MPGVSLHARLIRIVEQTLHIGGIEWLGMGVRELRSDVGQVEIDSIALRRLIDPMQIADPLRLDQRTNGAPADLQSSTCRVGPGVDPAASDGPCITRGDRGAS